MTPARRAQLPVALRVVASAPGIVGAGVAGHLVGPGSPFALLALLALCWFAALAPWRHDRGTTFSWGRMGGPDDHEPRPQPPRREADPCT